jgi:crotonobetainyl-CoA:carnitine CoA-transferase CaiB-like acyl-CoA transferase
MPEPRDDAPAPAAAGPLAGLTVLDLSRILAGPTCTQLLGDLGADVVKIEKPGAGDDTRSWGPPYVRDAAGADTTESAYYLCANRNKRSVTVDMARPEGQELIRRLAAGSDVVIENFKTGALDRYGLGPDALRADLPRLVYCSISGFGRTGPYKDRAGYDFLIQAMGGIMSVTGTADGEPTKVGVGIADVMCGMYAAVAILAAIRHRDATGAGQWIDLALFDSQIAWLINAGTNYLTSGRVPGRLGNGHPNIVPYQTVEAADRPFVLAVGNDAQFARFCAVAGLEGVADDPRFATNAARVGNRRTLMALIEQATRTRPADRWIADLEAVGVPCGPVNTLDRVFDDPQAAHRGMRIEMDHPLAGDGAVSLIGNPLKLSATPVTYRHAPPTLGEHTDAVLGERLGLGAADLAALRDKGVI